MPALTLTAAPNMAELRSRVVLVSVGPVPVAASVACTSTPPPATLAELSLMMQFLRRPRAAPANTTAPPAPAGKGGF